MPALELLQAGTAESVSAARKLLEKAVRIDPNYAAAYSMIAQSHWFDVHWGYVNDIAEAARQIGRYAEMALERAPDSGHAHLMKAAYELESGNRKAAHQAGSHACRLSPNNAFVRVGFARISIDAGFPADAEVHMRAAMRLNPFYPTFYNGILANALELQGKDKDAIAELRAAVSKSPGYFAGHLRLASLLAITGNIEQAQYHALEAHRLNPRFGMEGLVAFYRTPDESAQARFLQGLRNAGMALGTTDQS